LIDRRSFHRVRRQVALFQLIGLNYCERSI
jgi:hypothetical protein